MLAVISDDGESSGAHSPVTEKLATLGNPAEDGRTNGNGNARRESERDESEGNSDTEEGESEDGEDDAEEETSDVKVSHDRDDDGGKEEDDDENEEEDGDNDDDEEEEEPSLKYERMGGAVNDLLKKDSASALAVSSKCLVCTLSTSVGVLDLIVVIGPWNPWWHRSRVQSGWGAYQVFQTPPSFCERHRNG